MTKKELGERTRIIREEILQLTQQEMEAEIGIAQTLVSRIENGRWTGKQLVQLVNYYWGKGLNAHMILHEPFDKRMMIKDATKEEIIQTLEEVVQQMKKL